MCAFAENMPCGVLMCGSWGEKGANGADAIGAQTASCTVRHAAGVSAGSSPVGISAEKEGLLYLAPTTRGRVPHMVIEGGEADFISRLDSAVSVRGVPVS